MNSSPANRINALPFRGRPHEVVPNPDRFNSIPAAREPERTLTMCGIAGIIDLQGIVRPETVLAMCRAIEHRGPDHSGQFQHTSQGMSVGLGSQRLSIIDLSTAGNQPISNEANDIWIVYNGELYNHAELRRELEARGHRYRSHTDTETIIHAYEEYGIDCLSRFNGMFAFALYDQRRNEVVLARDPMGVKPLYYRWQGRQLAFSSELCGLIEAFPGESFSTDPAALSIYLSFGYVPSPFCIYEGVKKLPPGASMILKDQELRTAYYWTPQPLAATQPVPAITDLVSQTQALVESAVRRQLMSDVPVGVFLSGGLDSSIVTMLAQRHHGQAMDTFSIGFADERGEIDTTDLYNQDLVHARIVSNAFGTRHHEIVFPAGDGIASQFEAAMGHIDEPVWETSFVSIQLMAQLARSNGVKVVLTGDGGDELFAGYPWYAGFSRFQRIRRLPFLRAGLPLLSMAARGSTLGIKARDLRLRLDRDEVGHYQHHHEIFSESLKHELIRPDASAAPISDPVRPFIDELIRRTKPHSLLEMIAVIDLSLWVREHFNQRVDRMTSMHSVEARVPLQDMEVVRFALSIPMTIKLKKRQPKYLLREAFGADLPSAVMKRPKRPFATPTWSWLRGPLRSYTLELLSPRAVHAGGLLDADTVHRIVTAFMAGDDSHAFRVWTLINLAAWQHVNQTGSTFRSSTPRREAIHQVL